MGVVCPFDIIKNVRLVFLMNRLKEIGFFNLKSLLIKRV
jgi:hypothetical protein